MPTRYRVEIGPAAERDIRSIQGTIARDKPRAARKWVVGVRDKMRSLALFPERCELIPEGPDVGPDYRHLIFGNYRIIYRVEERRVIVVRVLHAARLLTAEMLQGERS